MKRIMVVHLMMITNQYVNDDSTKTAFLYTLWWWPLKAGNKFNYSTCHEYRRCWSPIWMMPSNMFWQKLQITRCNIIASKTEFHKTFYKCFCTKFPFQGVPQGSHICLVCSPLDFPQNQFSESGKNQNEASLIGLYEFTSHPKPD